MRVEELIELQWGDIDFRKGVIRVCRARTCGEAKRPKTETGTREITLLEPARAALVAQKVYTYLIRGHVFHDPRTDAPYATDKQFREWQWRPALRKPRCATATLNSSATHSHHGCSGLTNYRNGYHGKWATSR
jgi:integrase